MNVRIPTLLVACVAAANAVQAPRVLAQLTRAEPPRVFMLDAEALEKQLNLIRAGDVRALADLKKLRAAADRALEVGPFSVVHKNIAPPSGDKHDYMSMAPYWWPDPGKPDGLPYIRRDGEVNPEIKKVPDHDDLGRMVDAVETLALAHHFTGDEKYAERAALLLRTWYLDPATRMNPHLRYAQAIRGVNDGRGIGIIETRSMSRAVDAVGLLAGAHAWTPADQRALVAWFSAYLDWLLASDHGRDEADELNNHGTMYDVQAASFALFVGRKEVARDVLAAVGEKRIAVQIEPDGRQPLELARTKAWSYSTGNLTGLMALARLGEQADVDLWNYETGDGRSIRRALEFLTPFAAGEQQWSHQQIDGQRIELKPPLVRLAAEKYPDGPWAALAGKHGRETLEAAALWRSPLMPPAAWRE
jgi:hypothetical protein